MGKPTHHLSQQRQLAEGTEAWGAVDSVGKDGKCAHDFLHGGEVGFFFRTVSDVHAHAEALSGNELSLSNVYLCSVHEFRVCAVGCQTELTLRLLPKPSNI